MSTNTLRPEIPVPPPAGWDRSTVRAFGIGSVKGYAAGLREAGIHVSENLAALWGGEVTVPELTVTSLLTPNLNLALWGRTGGVKSLCADVQARLTVPAHDLATLDCQGDLSAGVFQDYVPGPDGRGLVREDSAVARASVVVAEEGNRVLPICQPILKMLTGGAAGIRAQWVIMTGNVAEADYHVQPLDKSIESAFLHVPFDAAVSLEDVDRVHVEGPRRLADASEIQPLRTTDGDLAFRRALELRRVLPDLVPLDWESRVLLDVLALNRCSHPSRTLKPAKPDARCQECSCTVCASHGWLPRSVVFKLGAAARVLALLRSPATGMRVRPEHLETLAPFLLNGEHTTFFKDPSFHAVHGVLLGLRQSLGRFVHGHEDLLRKLAEAPNRTLTPAEEQMVRAAALADHPGVPEVLLHAARVGLLDEPLARETECAPGRVAE